MYVVFGVWSESRNVQQKSSQVVKDVTEEPAGGATIGISEEVDIGMRRSVSQ